jgi:DNA (cytosine-5)-methyltransferase 1
LPTSTATRSAAPTCWPAGVPCPPFSIAGKQLGDGDDRDPFPHLRLAEEISPRAVLLENVRGVATARFDGYRAHG